MTFNWTSFLTNSTLQVVKLGTGDRPKYGDNCLVQCVFIQKPVQEEIQGNSLSPLKFWLPLGRGFYSKELEKIVCDLCVGSQCVIRSLKSASDTSNSVVSIELSLLDIVVGDRVSVEWKESGLALERVSKLKEEAKLLWSQYSEESTEHIKQAIDKYEEALETLYSSTTALEEKSCMEVRISLHCNLAICYNRISKPYMAYFHSNAALQMKPTETKALLQRAKAYLQLGDLFSAFGDVQQLEASGKGHDMATIRLKTQIEKAIDEQSQKNDKEVVENFQIRLHTRSFFIPSDSDTAAD